jgi:hypothetical protein
MAFKVQGERQALPPLYEGPAQAAQKQQPSSQKSRRKGVHPFSRGLLERESQFVDPHKEAQLIVPEYAVEKGVTSQISIETQLSAEMALEAGPKLATGALLSKRRRANIVRRVIERVMAIVELLKRRVHGARAKRRLTQKGEMATDQLRFLAQLCDASECRTPEETIAAEGAFGEAYYEIMSLSSNLAKMSEPEAERHLEHYARQMARVLEHTK